MGGVFTLSAHGEKGDEEVVDGRGVGSAWVGLAEEGDEGLFLLLLPSSSSSSSSISSSSFVGGGGRRSVSSLLFPSFSSSPSSERSNSSSFLFPSSSISSSPSSSSSCSRTGHNRSSHRHQKVLIRALYTPIHPPYPTGLIDCMSCFRALEPIRVVDYMGTICIGG